MSGLELNKIVGAILVTALSITVIGYIGDALVKPRQQVATAVAVPEGGATPDRPQQPTGPEPVAPLLAAASLDKGQNVAKKCVACHTFEKGGANKVGPHLYGVLGRDIASVSGFSFSNALQQKEGNWTYENLNEFLYKPSAFARGTKMAFAGLPKASDRAEIIAYLRSLNDSPPPLPEAAQ